MVGIFLLSYVCHMTRPTQLLRFIYMYTGKCNYPNNFIPVILPANTACEDIPKRRHIKFRRREIAQKKEYNIQNRAKVWNQEVL